MILLSDALPAARAKNRFGMIAVATSMQRHIFYHAEHRDMGLAEHLNAFLRI